MNTQSVLETMRKTGALLSGHFELRSGLHSDQYFQCALLLQHPDVAGKLCKELVDKMRGALPAAGKIAGVIAPALGGIVVGHEVARALGVKSIFAEKKEGDLVLRRGFRIERGDRFVVAEDVVTRGGRVQQTIDIVKANGGIVVAVATIVNRSGGKAKFEVPMFSLLEMEPVTYEPGKCPLCAKGEPMDHPGS